MDKDRQNNRGEASEGDAARPADRPATSPLRPSGADLQRLQEQLARARNACRQCTELLFSTSHELRTPLNGIVGFADLLLAGEADELRRDYLNTIRASALDLLGTINDLLDVARLERGTVKLERRDFCIREQIEDALSLVSPQACAKGLELVAYVRPDVPQLLQGDPHRLRQVLLNLLGNAVKYTASGSVVVCASVQGADPAAAMLRVEIRDTGGGVRAPYQARAFEAPGPAEGDEPESTGLGLWISRELVGLMRGQMGMQSVAGRGSSFWFMLPIGVCAKQPAPLPRFSRAARVLVHEPHPVLLRAVCQMLRSWGLRPVPAASRGALHRLRGGDPKLAGAQLGLVSVTADAASGTVDGSVPALFARHCEGPLLLLAGAGATAMENLSLAGVAACLSKPIRERGLHRILGRLLGEAPAHRTRTDAPAAAPQPEALVQNSTSAHVLLVDDDAVSRKLVCELLKQRPVRLTVATNGPDAVALAASEAVDLVLMDIHLPGMDGLAATRHIRASGRSGRQVPVIGLTADAVAEHHNHYLQAGIRECLYKPLDIQRFWKVVDGILGEVPGYAVGAGAHAPAPSADSLMLMLLEELPGRRQQIVSTLRENDLPGLSEAAHGLAGAASYCGQLRLKDAAQWVVREVRAGDRKGLAAASAALLAAMDEVVTEQRGPEA